MNKKSLANTVLKRNSQKPNAATLKMLRFVSVEVLFRLCMMALKRNAADLKTQMEANLLQFPPDIVSDRISKMGEVLAHFYPLDEGSKNQFSRLEKLVGHDLFVKSIMAGSKSVSTKPQFSRDIPRFQWEAFVNAEVALGHPAPERNALFMPPVEDQVPNSKFTPTKRKYLQEERVTEKDYMQPVKKKKQESVGSPKGKSMHKSGTSVDSKKKRKPKGLNKSKQVQTTGKTKHKLDKKLKPSGKHSPRHSPHKSKSEDQEVEQNIVAETKAHQHKPKLSLIESTSVKDSKNKEDSKNEEESKTSGDVVPLPSFF